jgi:hypothetical protein
MLSTNQTLGLRQGVFSLYWILCIVPQGKQRWRVIVSSSQFTSAMLKNRPIHVIGLGSLGGPLADSLFRKGVPELHLWDFDVVEARNRFNQRVFEEDIDKPKVVARERILREIYPESPTKIVPHQERVVAGTPFSGIVLAAVDWNRIRYKEVLPCVEENPEVTFFADGRVGMDGGKAYGFDPNNRYQVQRYKDPIHNRPDPENAELYAGCKSEFPLPENAEAVAAEMLWRLIRWLHLEQGSPDPYDNFVGWQYVPQRIILTEQWDTDTLGVMRRRSELGVGRYVGKFLDLFET